MKGGEKNVSGLFNLESQQNDAMLEPEFCFCGACKFSCGTSSLCGYPLINQSYGGH